MMSARREIALEAQAKLRDFIKSQQDERIDQKPLVYAEDRNTTAFK
jgi:hypothetical protein